MVQGTLAKSQKCSSSISPEPMTADDEHQTSSQYHTDGLEDLPTTQASFDDERKLHEFPESLRLFYADPTLQRLLPPRKDTWSYSTTGWKLAALNTQGKCSSAANAQMQPSRSFKF